MNKKLKILFTVSVIFNVLLLGIHSGMAYKHVSDKPWHKVRESLAPETKHVMARQFQKNRSDMKPIISEARAQKKAVLRVLQAENFDQDKFEREVKKLQKLQGKVRGYKAQSVGELAAQLSLEERTKLSGFFSKVLSDRGRGGRHKKKRDMERSRDKAE